MLLPLLMNITGMLGQQASNWQGSKFPGSRKLTREEEKRERIRLGILPPEQEAIADSAVVRAVDATTARAIGSIPDGVAVMRAMEALEAFREAYREEYREAYLEEVVMRLWAEETRKRRNLVAAFLLLH